MPLGLTGADYTCNFDIRFYTSVKLNCGAAADNPLVSTSGAPRIRWASSRALAPFRCGVLLGHDEICRVRFSGLCPDLEFAIARVIVAQHRFGLYGGAAGRGVEVRAR